jgi:hypothetical protein
MFPRILCDKYTENPHKIRTKSTQKERTKSAQAAHKLRTRFSESRQWIYSTVVITIELISGPNAWRSKRQVRKFLIRLEKGGRKVTWIHSVKWVSFGNLLLLCGENKSFRCALP